MSSMEQLNEVNSAENTKKCIHTGRYRKRISVILHTHVALIIICILAALDASFVMGQIICDILIMKQMLNACQSCDMNLTSPLMQSDSLKIDSFNILSASSSRYEMANSSSFKSHVKTAEILITKNPGFKNHNIQPSFQNDVIKAMNNCATNLNFDLEAETKSTTEQSHMFFNVSFTVRNIIVHFLKILTSTSSDEDKKALENGQNNYPCAALSNASGNNSHGVLYKSTHSFHLGSVTLLAILLLEKIIKLCVMGKDVFHVKLEIFDAFVLTVSFTLDLVFWDGIWAHPESTAATILIFFLPWRVIRIVNSSVLVIQEKDNVHLKLVKQRLRTSVKKHKDTSQRVSLRMMEIKQLEELCKNHGATNDEISACRMKNKEGSNQVMLLASAQHEASLAISSDEKLHSSTLEIDSISGEDETAVQSQDLVCSVSFDPTDSSSSKNKQDTVFTISKCDLALSYDICKQQKRRTRDNPACNVDSQEKALFSETLADVRIPSACDGKIIRTDEENFSQKNDDVEVIGENTASKTTNVEESFHNNDIHKHLCEKCSYASTESDTSWGSCFCSNCILSDSSAQDIPPSYKEVFPT